MNALIQRRGFTLIELLVAAGITALLAGLMVSVVAQAAELWTRSAGRLSCEAKARVVLEHLASDLGGSCFRDTGGRWFTAELATEFAGDLPGARTKPVHASSLALGGDRLQRARFGAGGTWLCFITTRRGRNTRLETISAAVAVGYRIARRDGTYVLCRAEVPPERLLGTEMDVAAFDYPLHPVMAENVIDFGVRCLFRDAGRDAERWVYPPIPAAADDAAQFPAVVDVLVRILTEEGARRLGRFERGDSPPGREGSSAETWWGIAEQHSHVFTRRVVINAPAP